MLDAQGNIDYAATADQINDLADARNRESSLSHAHNVDLAVSLGLIDNVTMGGQGASEVDYGAYDPSGHRRPYQSA